MKPHHSTKHALSRAATIPDRAGGQRAWLRWSLLGGLLLAGFATAYGAVVLSRDQPVEKPSPLAPIADHESTTAASCGSGGGELSPSTEPPSLPPGVVLHVNDGPAPKPAPDGMVWVPGGVCWCGSDTPGHRDARPWHVVEVSGFWMDLSPVSNEQFEKFVRATGYRTVAERAPKAEDFPGAPPEKLVAGAVVFSPPTGPVPLDNHLRWWDYKQGANWRHPEGPQSDLKGREKHPVLQVAFEDAQAYCRWAGKRLPTEAEFEFAARGGLDRKRYAWGDEFRPSGKWMANIWQGHFPYENTCEDGFRATSPVGSFPANRFGLCDMAGNVWEWCSDWYRYDYYQTLASGPQPARNPQGPPDSLDPAEPGIAKRVLRGGSYLCTDQYCTAYEVGARGEGAADSGTNHVGFRCVKQQGASK